MTNVQKMNYVRNWLAESRGCSVEQIINDTIISRDEVEMVAIVVAYELGMAVEVSVKDETFGQLILDIGQ